MTLGSWFSVKCYVQLVDDGLQVVAEVFAKWPAYPFVDGLHECKKCRSGAIFGSVGFCADDTIDQASAVVWEVLAPGEATAHLGVATQGCLEGFVGGEYWWGGWLGCGALESGY